MKRKITAIILAINLPLLVPALIDFNSSLTTASEKPRSGSSFEGVNDRNQYRREIDTYSGDRIVSSMF